MAKSTTRLLTLSTGAIAQRTILSHGSTEYVDWADPILQPPLRIANGMAIPSDRPGNGFAWDADVVAKYRLG